MYTAMLEAQDDDAAFYANFEQLGYNRALELDEAGNLLFTLLVF